jgi:thermostable hemolysin
MPTLLALEGRGERVCGVVGFRTASAEPLFLEHYLARPIEAELSERTGQLIDRERIVEVGNLASLSCRAAFHLVAILPRVLIERGNQWIVFTATSAVRGILEKFSAPMIELASASRECIGEPGDWGQYYENDPRVMAGYLPDGLGLALNCARSR